MRRYENGYQLYTNGSNIYQIHRWWALKRKVFPVAIQQWCLIEFYLIAPVVVCFALKIYMHFIDLIGSEVECWYPYSAERYILSFSIQWDMHQNFGLVRVSQLKISCQQLLTIMSYLSLSHRICAFSPMCSRICLIK